MYNSFQNTGSQQQQFYTGNTQPTTTGTGLQADLSLRHATTTTDFGDFVYNNQSNTDYQQSTQQQATGYNQQLIQQQATGYNQQPIQQQATGYNQQPMLQQTTGFGQQPATSFGTFQQSYNQQLNPQITGNASMPQTSFGTLQSQKLLPQNTGFYRQQDQQQTNYLKPTATGYVNSVAQNSNFNNQMVIPNLRLNFVTIDDQKKFEKLFRSKVSIGSNTISGTNCREILMRSGLPPKQLAQIWNLADTLKAGELMFPEFVLAMYLINSVLQGEPLPFALEKKIRDEVTKFVDAINFQVGESAEILNSQQQHPIQNPTPFDNLTNGIQLQPQPTGLMPSTSFGDMGQFNPQNLQPQNTGFMPQTSFGQQLQQQQTGFNNQWNNGLQPSITGSQAPQTSFGNFNASNTIALRANQTGLGLMAQPTGVLPSSNFNINLPLTAQKTGFGNNDLYSQSNFTSKFTAENEDYVTSEEKALFYKIFETYDTQNNGILDSKTSVEIFRKSGLNRQDLEQIWNLSDADNTGKLNKQEFTVGMHLVYRKLNGHALPNVLPRSLVPQSTQIIDMMKDKLKSDVDIKSAEIHRPGLNDNLAFKSTDELPSFRNRKNSKVDVDLEIQKKKDEEDQNLQETEKLKSLIRDKKILIDAEMSKNEDRFKERQLRDLENLKQIEIVKSSIVSLPQPVTFQGSHIQSSFEDVNAKLISVLSGIDTVEKAIINTKVQLFKKQNPSSISGTGLNGEITEQDIRKAKKKAELAERMALLTGKPVVSSSNFEKEEIQLKEAIFKINAESNKNKETVEFIKKDIDEMFSNLKSNLYGKSGMEKNTQKFDLGVGLESEVKEFIKHLSTTRNASKGLSFNTKLSSNVQSSNRATKLSSLSPTPTPATSVGKDKTLSESKTSKDRAAYIKEQAQQRMNEKLEKLGLGKRNRRNNFVASENSNVKVSSFESVSSPVMVSTSIESSISAPVDSASDGEEDEEELALRMKLEALRQKKIQKQERMKKMQEEIDAAEKEEFTLKIGEAPAIESINRHSKETEAIESNNLEADTKKSSKDDEWEDEVSTPVSQQHQQQHHKFNPFARSPGVSETTLNRKTQFFQQPVSTVSSQLSFDSKAAEEQRRIQRGISNDSDGWSDDEPLVKKSAPTIAVPKVAAPSFVNTNFAASSPSFIAPVPSAPNLSEPAEQQAQQISTLRTISKEQTPIYEDEGSGWSDEEDNTTSSAPIILSTIAAAPVAQTIPAVPVAPALQMQTPVLSSGLNIETADDDGDLSLPESVSSDED